MIRQEEAREKEIATQLAQVEREIQVEALRHTQLLTQRVQVNDAEVKAEEKANILGGETVALEALLDTLKG